MSISISALVLTDGNYMIYRGLIPKMDKLATLEAKNQPKITELPDAWPDSLKEINVIETGILEIHTLPRWLEYLYCQKNRLKLLPEQMPKNLKVLNCSENKLISLPQLPQTLKILYCSNNPLASVSQLFPDSLSMLDISGCGLTELPARLPKSLTKLKCNNNQLVQLPTQLPTQLNSIDCSFNLLVELPHLPENLLVIDARHNNLSIFDFTKVRANMRINIDFNNHQMPEYKVPLTHRSNIEYNITLTQRTIWLRRMQIMKDELLTNSHRICYSPSRIERLIASGEFDITQLASEL